MKSRARSGEMAASISKVLHQSKRQYARLIYGDIVYRSQREPRAEMTAVCVGEIAAIQRRIASTLNKLLRGTGNSRIIAASRPRNFRHLAAPMATNR